MRASTTAAAGLLLLASNAAAIKVDANNYQSIIDAAGTIAKSVMSRYMGNKGNGNVPGLFPELYYFWESGLAWDSMIAYSAFTGDHQYDDAVSQGMLWQVGPDYNYMPPNQSTLEGNDDQRYVSAWEGNPDYKVAASWIWDLSDSFYIPDTPANRFNSFWALAAMTAEETGFTLPDSAGVDSWLQLAQNVFDSQVLRWDNDTCGGGLRWQLYAFNNGYNYKNSLSNGNFMQLAARLYASTQNETYAEWFNTAADWMAQVGLYNEANGAVYDGTSVTQRCSQLNHLQWTANSGTLLSAYAYMIATNSDSVNDKTPLPKILVEVLKIFVQDGVLSEVACLPTDSCNVDQTAFRAILARALATVRDGTSQYFNSTAGNVLASSAEAAGAQCSGGNGTICGADWTASSFDGSSGLSADLSALNIMLANLPQRFSSGSSSNSTTGTTGGSDNSTSSSGSGGSQTSSGDASQTSGLAGASASVPVQGENMGEQRAASMFGLLGALGFAVAFFL